VGVQVMGTNGGFLQGMAIRMNQLQIHSYVTLVKIQILVMDTPNSLVWALCPPFDQGNMKIPCSSFTKIS
jgi:hypothetical protein